MDNFRDSRVVHGPKTQRNFPRALLVDHLHDRWAAWVMEALRCVYFFKRIRFFLLYIIYVYAYIYIYGYKVHKQMSIYDYNVKCIVYIYICMHMSLSMLFYCETPNLRGKPWS